MALKLNIRADLEEEMKSLLPKTSVRSKTEYINEAIREYNQKVKREVELSRLRFYFKNYHEEGKKVLNDFRQIRKIHD